MPKVPYLASTRVCDQPDVAVKANDHERLVAMLVYVLPAPRGVDPIACETCRCWLHR